MPNSRSPVDLDLGVERAAGLPISVNWSGVLIAGSFASVILAASPPARRSSGCVRLASWMTLLSPRYAFARPARSNASPPLDEPRPGAGAGLLQIGARARAPSCCRPSACSHRHRSRA